MFAIVLDVKHRLIRRAYMFVFVLGRKQSNKARRLYVCACFGYKIPSYKTSICVCACLRYTTPYYKATF